MAPATGQGLSQVCVEAANPMSASLHPCSSIEEVQQRLEQGQVLVHISKLVLTANSLTYAIAGNMEPLSYFKHFPADTQGYGRSPCWGHGVVVASRCPEVREGTRVHGLFPLSPWVVLTPTKVSAEDFVDGAPHRAGLIGAYLTYSTSESPRYKGLSGDSEDFQMAAGTLFSTGWAMCQTAAIQAERPTAMLLTSASSRTSMGAAFAAKFHKLPLEVIGLTSEANAAYVRGLGTYDRVCPYSDVASLPRQKVAVFDVAGDAKTLESVYRHFGESIVHCSRVGMTHVASAGRQPKLEGLGGASPVQFLVFTGLQEADKAYGPKESAKMLDEASSAFRTAMMPTFRSERVFGGAATLEAFGRMARGEAQPDITYVCSLWPREKHEPVLRSKM